MQVQPVEETPVPAEPATRRAELLAIAVKLFASQGVANTTVRDIADAAGILSGSLYHHFDSKDQMVAEAIGTGLMANTAANRQVIDQAADPATALVGLISSAIRWVGRKPDVVTILTNDKAYIHDNPALEGTEATRQETRLIWLEVIEAGADAGVFRRVAQPDVVVRSIFDGIFGSARWMYGEIPAKQVASELAAFYLQGLLADGFRYDFERGELITPADTSQ